MAGFSLPFLTYTPIIERTYRTVKHSGELSVLLSFCTRMGCRTLTTFYSRFLEKCNEINKKPSAVVVAIGLSKSAVTRWKAGNLPTDATIEKLADYFGVSSEWLSGEADKQEARRERIFENFTRLCNENGVTELEALLAIGISPDISSQWMEMKKLPVFARIMLAKHFGVSTDEFYAAKKEPPAEVGEQFSPLDSRWFSLTEEEKLQAWEYIVKLRAKNQGGDKQ